MKRKKGENMKGIFSKNLENEGKAIIKNWLISYNANITYNITGKLTK